MRRVRDVYLTLSVTPRVSFKIFMVLGFIAAGALVWRAQTVPGKELVVDGILAVGGVLALSVLAALVVFINYSRGVVIAPDSLSFPASDVENSLLALLLGKSLWGHLFRERLPLADVEHLANDGHGKRWRLNVSGVFGSRQIEFSSKQKRDECRAALLRYLRAAQADANLDFSDYSE